MDKLATETSTSATVISATAPTEKRALSEVMHNTKRSGGNYGSLAKSQLQPTLYISHKVESDDSLQRLALKYSVNIQEIKRVNKLWSDVELRFHENVFIPVNSSQLMTLRSLYPTLNVVQSPSPTTTRTRKLSTSSNMSDDVTASLRSSDSSTSIPAAATTTTSLQDYFSKIDQQISSSKKSLQSLDSRKQHLRSQNNDVSGLSHTSNGNTSDDSTSSQNSRSTAWNNGQNHPAENNVFVSISTQNSRSKHISAALERIQREKDDFDEL